MFVTGTLFFVGAPDQYIDNPAWYGKLLFLAVAMVNIAIFETTQGARMLRLPAGERTPATFKLAGAVSMGSWLLVLYFGRMLPFLILRNRRFTLPGARFPVRVLGSCSGFVF